MGIKLKIENVEELRDTKVYMVGRLARGNEFEQPISTDIKNHTRFIIIPLCKEPEPIEDVSAILPNSEEISSYIGFDSNLKLYLPIEYKYSNYKEKENIIEHLLQNKLIIFKTNINVNEEIDKKVQKDGYRDYKIFKNMTVEKILDIQIDEKDELIRVPKLNIREKDFISKLRDGDYIELVEYPTYLEAPEYIICDKNMYYFNSYDWEKHSSNKNMWSYRGNIDNLMIFEIENMLLDEEQIILCSNYTYFIAKKIIENNPGKINTISEIVNDEEEKGFICKDIKEIPVNYYKKQIDFLKGIELYCKSKGLGYKYEDIVNLHISIKTNFITIISGMTGTGKSQLAWAYAKMLDASLENENLLFIPISPNYMEPSDILGYYNPNIGMYTPSETGLVDFLVKAQKNSNKEFIIIFDEMNLSQVEHWFAPFISLLEADENNRFLYLYSKNSRCINDEKYPSIIKIGNNIRIIGTINLDETIKEFSERLLDRANVINLEKLRFSELSQAISYNLEHDFYEKYICGDSEEFKNWTVEYSTIEILEDKLHFFDELHDIIAKYDSRKGVSFRVINAIAAYIANIPINEDGEKIISESYAIDLQVKQRIVSKLKGTKRTIGNLIGEYDDELDLVIGSKIIEFLEKEDIEKISNFEKTKEFIKHKAKELNLYGYTY